jgi:hypothetical protein
MKHNQSLPILALEPNSPRLVPKCAPKRPVIVLNLVSIACAIGSLSTTGKHKGGTSRFATAEFNFQRGSAHRRRMP